MAFAKIQKQFNIANQVDISLQKMQPFILIRRAKIAIHKSTLDVFLCSHYLYISLGFFLSHFISGSFRVIEILVANFNQ